MDPKVKKNGKKLLGSNAVIWRFMVGFKQQQLHNNLVVAARQNASLNCHQHCVLRPWLAAEFGAQPTLHVIFAGAAAVVGAVGGCAGSHVRHFFQPGARGAGPADVSGHGGTCAVQAGALQVITFAVS
jgi:hypothetical protein